MYRLSVIFGETDTNWAFLFRTKDKADSILALRTATPHTKVIFDDDFGQHAEIEASCIKGVMLENLDESRMAAVEMGLHQARVQAKAQELAKTDPILRAAMTANSRGPSVLTPHFPQ